MKKGGENRNFDTSGDLYDAIENWLGAREQWLGGCDPEKLERFTTATEVLYVAFAHDWTGDDHSLATAFHLVRGSLAEDGGDWGYRHLEVSVVYPHRAK